MAVRKTKKKSKKNKNNRKNILIFIAILLVIGVICSIYLLNTADVFNITKIEVNNISNYTYEQIIDTANILVGQNINKISKSDAISNLENLPYVKAVQIYKKYPNVIQIVIKERETFFYAYNKDNLNYIRLDSEGVILEVLNELSLKSENEYVVIGINFDDNLVLGEKILDKEIEKIQTFKYLKNKYDEMKIESIIDTIKYEDNRLIITTLGGLDVMFNTDEIIDDKLEYKLGLLKAILNNLNQKSGTIDMTLENPTYSIVRK